MRSKPKGTSSLTTNRVLNNKDTIQQGFETGKRGAKGRAGSLIVYFTNAIRIFNTEFFSNKSKISP